MAGEFMTGLKFSALVFAAAIALSMAPARVLAQQQLIPTPYPAQLGSGAVIDASPPVTRHQRLVPTPYPRTLGPNALGNPSPQYRRRHQRLVKPPYPRQYR
jgi:hypothetical protein